MKVKFFSVLLLGSIMSACGGLYAQVSFSNIAGTLSVSKVGGFDHVVFSAPPRQVKFDIKRKVREAPQEGFIRVDDQVVQVVSLGFEGYKEGKKDLDLSEQRVLLETYAGSEMSYYRNELGVEVLDPRTQWTEVKGRHWLIWYYKVGKVPAGVSISSAFDIQLYALTVMGNGILVLNAPASSKGGFQRTAGIVNGMMESMVVVK